MHRELVQSSKGKRNSRQIWTTISKGDFALAIKGSANCPALPFCYYKYIIFDKRKQDVKSISAKIGQFMQFS